ncbi:sulfur carrier protein ThiS [Pelagibius sp. CAU 1746]|uniref:sulfur carrier protein ThiS n=1 Tax=Pelagibius sp. CAU 1746 TaxID=3140370 RepID=UPI00325BEB04
MQIVLNGKPREVKRDRLDRLLEELGYRDATVATAVNGNFVARPARAAMRIEDGDRVEVIAPMQGG